MTSVDLDFPLIDSITCMSPYRPSNQRRRSLSVTPSSFHDQLCIDLCHPPAKRTHSRKDLPRQWDLDSWRRGKRPRTQQISVRPTICRLFRATLTLTSSLVLPLLSLPRGWRLQRRSPQPPFSHLHLLPSILDHAVLTHHFLHPIASQVHILY